MKRKKRSLQRTVIIAVLFGNVFLIMSFFTFIFLQQFFLLQQHYKDSARNGISFAISRIGRDYLEGVFSDVKDFYYSLPEELREDQYSDEFIQRSASALVDEKYREARNILSECREISGLYNIMLFFPDEESNRIVIVFDASAEDPFLPGSWIDTNPSGNTSKMFRKILESDWRLSLAYGKYTGWLGSDFQEFRSADGELLGYVNADIQMNDFMQRITRLMTYAAPVPIIFMSFFATLISGQLKRSIVEPVNSLAEAARKYTARDKVSDEEETDFFSSVQVSTGDEIEELRDTMVEMEQNVAQTMKRIRRVTQEQEEMKRKQELLSTELNIAKDIQRSSLPVSAPDRPEFRLFASTTPAKEVGGDFYDYFMVDEDHLGLVIADVSGKGIPAALFMMTSKMIIQYRFKQGGTPAEVLADTNDRLSDGNDNAMFVTVWLGLLTVSTGEVIAASAGHEYPMITDENGEFRLFEDPHGMVCGLMPDLTYENYTFRLNKGSRLFVYTDGVAEATGKQEELFGTGRLEAALNRYKELSPEDLILQIGSELSTFSDGTEQFDDITMLCLKYDGP